MEPVLILLLFLALGTRGGKASGGGYQERHDSLVKRGASGAKWRAVLAAHAPLGFADWVDGVCLWIGIESGGKPGAKTALGEIGLTQIMRRYATEQGWSQAELDEYASASTPPARLAELVWKHVLYLDKGHPASWPTQARLWRAKMRHGLPLLLRELQDQGLLLPHGPEPGGAFDARALTAYKPSRRAARYATAGKGSAGQRLLVRFVTPADVVAGYRRGWSEVA